ncbi:hypothetical protein [Mycolicibacterium fluoranthenivorans]|uniref:Dopamine receptor D4 n=1 Tax=Mycolicibacterium fluoranthenivorans TaxID=258505 RepID=A0A1G4WQT8_9MYCO|nr:hypothetical protein [Mycolicibacterium fluoranthenivorans]SCX27125.1 hypothetical protein SAMN02799620_04221 [Mycolicibacterium fluoranthenivorans]
MAIDVETKILTALVGGVAALLLAVPAAADPTDAPPQPPVPVADAPVASGASGDGVPHLASPDALPPGSTMDPSVMAGAESPRVSYLRDLWNAVQNREISGKEALVLGLAQRGMDTPNPAPVPGPNTPLTPGDPAAAPAPVTP